MIDALTQAGYVGIKCVTLETVVEKATIPTNVDQASVVQDLDVVRDGGLPHAESLLEGRAGKLINGGHASDDLQASGVREDLEELIKGYRRSSERRRNGRCAQGALLPMCAYVQRRYQKPLIGPLHLPYHPDSVRYMSKYQTNSSDPRRGHHDEMRSR